MGELQVQFQLHVNTLLHVAKKSESTSLRKDNTVMAAEFVVGPGASFKRQASKSKRTVLGRSSDLRANSYHKAEDSELGRRGGTALSVSAVADSKGPPDSDHAPIIGRQQMEVISELLERGTVLRDKMVYSLALGTRSVQQQLRYG